MDRENGGRRPRSPAKVKRSEDTSKRLIEAAGKLIGRYGYSGCSIARITARAGVAHGAFYLHFKSQQELFDHLLPTLGAQMLDEISGAVRDSEGVLDLERKGITANFDYLRSKPYMYRVLREAQLYAPKAFERHNTSIVARYAKSLHRSMEAQQVKDFSEDEIQVVASMLIGARDYILDRYCVEGRVIRRLPAKVLDAYIQFVAHGLSAPPNSIASRTRNNTLKSPDATEPDVTFP
jgi:AcrR family transcriptional regulator